MPPHIYIHMALPYLGRRRRRRGEGGTGDGYRVHGGGDICYITVAYTALALAVLLLFLIPMIIREKLAITTTTTITTQEEGHEKERNYNSYNNNNNSYYTSSGRAKVTTVSIVRAEFPHACLKYMGRMVALWRAEKRRNTNTNSKWDGGQLSRRQRARVASQIGYSCLKIFQHLHRCKLSMNSNGDEDYDEDSMRECISTTYKLYPVLNILNYHPLK